jgi:hypothetical protein
VIRCSSDESNPLTSGCHHRFTIRASSPRTPTTTSERASLARRSHQRPLLRRRPLHRYGAAGSSLRDTDRIATAARSTPPRG